MSQKFLIPLESIVLALSEALDSASPGIAYHQLRVAYIASIIGKELGFEGKDLESLVIAGAFHDIGLLTTEEKLLAFRHYPPIVEKHVWLGYQILKKFSYFERAAEFVLYHHTPWEKLKSETDYQTALGSNIINLADKLEIKTRALSPILLYSGTVLRDFQRQKGKFAKEILEALAKVEEREIFWLNLEYFNKQRKWNFQSSFSTYLSRKDLTSLASLFAVIIDLRSPFTGGHSTGVASLAKWLGEVLGFSQDILQDLEIAGYLHDIGKLAIPEKILNKPGPLTSKEWAIIKSHPFITYRILEKIPHFEHINAWASSHHERLDGKGYPAKLAAKDLSLEARVLAVADVTTAILEDRPYRSRMTLTQARKVLKELSGKALDPQIVKLVIGNLDHVQKILNQAQIKRYESFESWGGIFQKEMVS